MKRKILVLALLSVVAAGAAGGSLAAAHAPTAAAKKAKLQLRKGKLGRFIVDARGMTLYLFEKDKNGKSACAGACAQVWAPYLTSGKPTAGSGVSAAKIGTTVRKSGRQVTYGGHPLYHYDDDKKPGQTKGEGSKEFGAEWYVLGANGKKIDKS